jgi:hypothetical protein
VWPTPVVSPCGLLEAPVSRYRIHGFRDFRDLPINGSFSSCAPNLFILRRGPFFWGPPHPEAAAVSGLLGPCGQPL